MNNKSSYRSIIKGNTLFGGVQIYNILISVIRSKIVAVLLGPQGMGIMGLLNSTVSLVQSLTNFGLGTSAVREVAIAKESNEESRMAEITTVLRRMVWLTGFLGAIITLVFAPQLSQFTFNNDDYTTAIRWLSVTLVLLQLSVAQNALLQGLHQLRSLAKASVLGSTIGLIITLPLYYFWHFDAIVPVIIITAAISLILSWHFSHKLKIESVDISVKDTFTKGKNMLVMGFLISLTGLMDSVITYLIQIIISNWGSIADVGLYNAGYAMISSYVGLVFSAIATDYFPRLTSVSNDKEKYTNVINQQADIMLLILCPLVLIFISFGNILIGILYSTKFLGIVEMTNWIAFGMIFRAISWCPGFMFIAKNDSKLYFIIYVITVIVTLAIDVFFYKVGGLTGLGVAFVVNYILSALSVIIITKWRYGFAFSKITIKLSIVVICFSAIALSITYVESNFRYIFLILILLISTIYSYLELDKRLDLKELMVSVKNKFSKR